MANFTTRYQVFLSSTFTDLKEERAEVIQALWELDCIPTGMEAFLASNLTQWEIIRRVIDECDYYILIIGGRYGSLTPEGISYTEKEYEYARKVGLPVLAFVHGAPDKIEVGKAEVSIDLRAKLETFRSKVMKAYPIREWQSSHELGALASRSLIQEIRRNPRPGWVRNDASSPVELLRRIDELSQENVDLKRKNESKQSAVPIDELSSGKDEVQIGGTYRLYTPTQSYFEGKYYRWDSLVTWDEIFRLIGPMMLNEASDREIKLKLAQYYRVDNDDILKKYNVNDSDINDSSFHEIIVQLRALGLIDKGSRKRGINDKQGYWQLTDFGDRYLVSLLALRKIPVPPAIPDDPNSPEEEVLTLP